MIVQKYPTLTDLSHELLCHILQYLPLQEILSISMLCKKLLSAVAMHLRLCKNIDFCEGKIFGYMPSSITDDHMHSLFKKCPNLETVYGLHPLKVERRRLRKRSALTVPGIIEALSLCSNLKSIETSDLRLLEAVIQHLPQLKIIGHFQNRDGVFPPHASQRLKLLPYPRISSLHLIGVEVPELTAMPHLEHLHLQCVRFTKLQPFRAFLATKLKTFVMKHCMGPSLSLRYLSLIIALSSSPALSRLELVRVPLPGGLFQRAVEDSYRHSGFINLKILVISGCKGVLEADLGHLMIVASKNLERVFIQPSLTRDSLFVSLSFAECEFPVLKNIHLGYVDKLDFSGEWTNDNLLSLGLAEVPDTPSSLTDSGMKVISQLFPNIKSMSVSNCPHLMAMDQWSPIDGEQAWKELTDLTLQRCHCLQLPSFALFLAFLPKIEVVILNDMFREPPKGCSHVGLSAGTGLGMSSAVVSNQDEHIAVQGHQQDFELQPDDHLDNEEMERDFIDADNEENPNQHIMVLQQEFFDEENHVAPAAVVQQENVNPEDQIENIQQEVPENHIRRELNEDYEAELNENQDGTDKKTHSSGFSELSSSSSDDDELAEPPYLNRGKRKRRTNREHLKNSKNISSKGKNNNNGDKSSKCPVHLHKPSESSDLVSASREADPENESLQHFSPPLNPAISGKVLANPEEEALFSAQPQEDFSIDLERVKDHDETCKYFYSPNRPSITGKVLADSEDEDMLFGVKQQEEQKLDFTRKEVHFYNRSCGHSKVCRKKCSRGFDPNQPSTSRGGNCLDCTCINSDSEFKETGDCVKDERNVRKSDRTNSNSGIKPSMPVSNKNQITLRKDSSYNENFTGPLTRHRKRILDQNVKREPPLSELPLKKCMKRDLTAENISQNGNEVASTSGKSSSDRLQPKNEVMESEDNKPPFASADQNVQDVEEVKVKVEPQESESNEPNRQKVKKHKKHKHKKCKRSSKCDKSCRRRGPLTRSRSGKYVHDGHNIVSQGTQATSADIRRSLRRQKNCSLRCKKRGNGSCGSSHRRSHNHISARQQFKRPKEDNSDVELHNKSTSTSDPLMEDDAVQTLRLVSETLISLTIISCGISDVVIDHCHSMTHVEVQACRILKNFQLHYCPSLKRLNISQCPKLSLEVIIPEVLSLVATRKLVVSYEPCMQIYYPADTEKAIFSRAPLEQSIILFHDYSGNTNENLQAAVKENLLRWMEIVQKLYYTPSFLFAKQKKKKTKSKESKARYPYGHYLRRIHGVFTLPPSIDPECTQRRYQILTNDHVFASALENIPWDNGFPDPETSEDYTEDDALLSMIETEYTEKNLKMRKKILSFYINVGDNSN